MAHESFADLVTAQLMNERFVNIKVDREERPDVDAIYMSAVQAMTGRGGWPLTAFLFPDGRPFFAGTYFPTEPRHGLPSFRELLVAVDEAWRTQRADVEQQANELTQAIRESSRLESGFVRSLPRRDAEDADGSGLTDPEVDLRDRAPTVLVTAVSALMSSHDAEWGGFGGAPKFPNTASLELLVRAIHRGADERVTQALVTSLDAMVSGGMYDHLGGGFARYSVDNRWIVPHFEKMLYDQSGLVRIYTHAYQLTGLERYRQVVDETVAYLDHDLRLADGGFASAEDADSEGEEGTFYVWTPADIDAVLGEELGATARAHWAVAEDGNFEGKSILTLAQRGSLLRDSRLDSARELLLAHRSLRTRPGLDDKVVTEWNALMISALSEAGRALDRPRYVHLAVDTANFLLRYLRASDGRWMRSWHRSAGAKHLAGAADLAALSEAFVRLSEATGVWRWLDHAVNAADLLLAHHEDPIEGGFFTVADDGETLLVRQKDLADNATPSATSNATFALFRLAAVTGDERYRASAVRALILLSAIAGPQPQAFAQLLCALDMYVDGVTEVVIAGPPSPAREALLDLYWSRHRPNAILAFGEPTDSPLWEGRRHLDHLRAYVCHNFVCERPTNDPAELGRLLGDASD